MEQKLKQIQISLNVWKKAKVYCAEAGITLKQFVEKLIEYGIKEKMQ